jgi:hypothetical protein
MHHNQVDVELRTFEVADTQPASKDNAIRKLICPKHGLAEVRTHECVFVCVCVCIPITWADTCARKLWNLRTATATSLPCGTCCPPANCSRSL